MKKTTFDKMYEQSMNGSLSDDLNPLFLFSTVNNELLCDIVNGKIDVVSLAKHELEKRGYNEKNEWVGFKSK
jgi:hypothetical protein